MSAQSQAIPLDHPDLYKPIDWEPERPITSKQAKELDCHAGWHKRAMALDRCGQTLTFLACSTGHTWHEVQTCHQRYCAACAKRRADKLYKRYMAIVQEYIIVNAGGLYLTINKTYSQEITPEDIQSFKSMIAAGLRKLFAAFEEPIDPIERQEMIDSRGALMQVHIHLYDQRLSAEVIIPGMSARKSPNPRITRFWPDLTLKISHRDFKYAEWSRYLRLLLDPKLPLDPVRRAQCEMLASGIRMFSAMGWLYGACSSDADNESSEKLFPEDPETPGNNLAKHWHAPGHTCPICHEPAVRRSETVSIDMLHVDKSTLRWFDEGPPA